jgi:glycine/D-amino acid oxidase-like deaminating enzyme
VPAVDVVVVGGGIQGLVVLRELVAAGYASVLITDADLGAGQTLHSHGLVNSGTGLVTGGLRREIHEVTVPYLRRLGLALTGADGSFLMAPPPMVDQLAPAWEANRYRPEPVDPSTLPRGFEPLAPVYRLHGFNVDKRRLVQALAEGLGHLVLRGEVVRAEDGVEALWAASGEVVALHAGAVVLAAGCGTKRLAAEVFGLAGPALDDITYTVPHMLCLRGRPADLPEVGTVLSPELIVVGHVDAGATSGDREVTWYVTPADPGAARHAEAPAHARAPVDPAVVARGVRVLQRLFPPLAAAADRLSATVFAGYKQELGEEATRRACPVLDEERNVLMALPSVLANAVPNALDVVETLYRRLEPSREAPKLLPETPVAVGEPNERTDQVAWATWGDFARAYGVDPA